MKFALWMISSTQYEIMEVNSQTDLSELCVYVIRAISVFHFYSEFGLFWIQKVSFISSLKLTKLKFDELWNFGNLRAEFLFLRSCSLIPKPWILIKSKEKKRKNHNKGEISV